MITDLILTAISKFYILLISFIPQFTFIDNLISAKDSFLNFLTEFISYSLWFFNIPVLKVALGILITYILFLSSEYIVKLFLKYTTSIL